MRGENFMKKILCLFLLITIIFTACKNETYNHAETTNAPSSTNQNETEFSSETQTNAISVPDLTKSDLSVLNNTTTTQKSFETTTLKPNKTTEEAHESAPMIIFLSLDELKEIKNAFDTMKADEFQAYIENEHSGAYMNGMWDYENSTALLDEMCSTYIPLLDGDVQKLDNFSFYQESNSILQLIIFDEDKRASVIINTFKSTKPKKLEFSNEAMCISEKTIEKDNYIAHLYEYQNTDYRFYAEILIDDTYIILRSGRIDTMEDFEECFNRLSFVKIGDLLSE